MLHHGASIRAYMVAYFDHCFLPSVSVVLDPASGQVLKKVREVKGEYTLTTPCGVTFTPSGMLCVADR